MICASKPAAERIAAAIDHAAHLLPAQGPIGVFIHQNTLHAFQHIRFEQAVCEAARKFGAEPYMSEDAYRHTLVSGRILPEDIRAILDAEPDEKIWPGGMMRNELRHSMLIKGASEFRTETIQWELHEGHLSQQLRPAIASELFEFCRFHQRIFVSKPRQTPFADNTFDYLVSSDVLGHIPFDKKDQIFGEIYRVLKKGGRTAHLIETDSSAPWFRFAKRDPKLFQLYFVDRLGHIGLETPTALRERFHRHGFKDVVFQKTSSNLQELGTFAGFFDNEYARRSAKVRAVVALDKLLAKNLLVRESLHLLMEPLALLDDWLTPIDYGCGMLVVFEK